MTKSLNEMKAELSKVKLIVDGLLNDLEADEKKRYEDFKRVNVMCKYHGCVKTMVPGKPPYCEMHTPKDGLLLDTSKMPMKSFLEAMGVKRGRGRPRKNDFVDIEIRTGKK